MTRLIIDGNSLLNQALLRGVDHENGRIIKDESGKEHQVNGAEYGVDGFFEKYEAALAEFSLAPVDAILVWDGANAKMRRRTFLPQYKAGRDKIPEVNEQLNAARDRVTQMVLALGSHVVSQAGLEADDVIGYLTANLRTQRNIVVTSDGDLSVLVDDNTDIWRLGELNTNPYGPFPHRFITLYKSLVGDSGDKIPGAKGFGDAAFVDLVRIFGIEGLAVMQELIENDQLHKLREDVGEFPKLQKIIDDAAGVATSWRCAKLMIDEVNTMRKPMTVQAGMVQLWDTLDESLKVHSLKRFYGTKTLVHAGNYEMAKARLVQQMKVSPFVALDIETSSTEESDEWLEQLARATESERSRIDVLGHELTGMSLTFGENLQHTVYMTVDHVETDQVKNITVDQCREMVEVIPQSLHIVIQNRSFEFSVLYRTWGEKWRDDSNWHGFVPNAIDTKIGASYVDENLPKGLKERSAHHLGYRQATYEETTQKRGPVGTLTGGVVREVYDVELEPAITAPNPKSTPEKPLKDIVVTPAVTEKWERREYKMNQLRAAEVFDYGCDDTICTGALHVHYRFVMELEGTWQIYLDVEQLPEYLTSLAFVQGVRVSLKKLRDMETKDDEAYNKAWETLRGYLLLKGWEGTVCPEFAPELEPADVKLAASILHPGKDFTTKKRKLEAIALDIRDQLDDEIFAVAVEKAHIDVLNKLVKASFTGEPKINFGSPKQLQNLFYNVFGMKPRVFNSLTEKQRQDPVMAMAFKKLRQSRDGKEVTYTKEEYEALKSKASTDDDVVELSLHRDQLEATAREALLAYQKIKKIQTRRQLFYKTYKAITHWRDGNVHSSINQCEAVTRRSSSSGPNLQQLPKLGDGKEFREVLLPHRAEAVIGSCDFSGQELRMMAEFSGDENLTSCYVGDNLRDVHSLTAVAASIYLWDKAVTYDEFMQMLESPDKEIRDKAKLLRGDGKTTNFGTQYGLQAENLSIKLKCDKEVAQQFIDAKARAFPRIDPWKEEVESEAAKLGYTTTMLGARRHLRDGLMAENSWDRSRAERQASNFKIQGSGAEQAKLAMSSMWRKGTFTGRYDAQFIAPVHDEVVFSMHKDCALEVTKEVHECMVQAYASMRIPIVSSISIGANFGEQIECGDFFDPKAINEALAAIFSKATETEAA